MLQDSLSARHLCTSFIHTSISLFQKKRFGKPLEILWLDETQKMRTSSWRKDSDSIKWKVSREKNIWEVDLRKKSETAFVKLITVSNMQKDKIFPIRFFFLPYDQFKPKNDFGMFSFYIYKISFQKSFFLPGGRIMAEIFEHRASIFVIF